MDDHPEGTLDTPEGYILIRRHLCPLFPHDVHDYMIRQWHIEQKHSNIYTDLR